MMKRLKEILVSLRLAIVLLLLLISMLFAGAYMMPLKKEFQSINSIPLLSWLMKNPFYLTWWLWISISILILLALNTLICSVDSILKKRRITGWLMSISPQIIHMGFLFILLAHLMSAIGGFKDYGVITEGVIINTGPDRFIRFERIDINLSQEGSITNWHIDVSRSSEGIVKNVSIRPNKPLFTDGIGIYVRDIQPYPVKAALVEVSKDPGAIWALTGAILFFTGTITLMTLRLRKERSNQK